MRYFIQKQLNRTKPCVFFTHGFLSAFDIAACVTRFVAFDQNLFGTRTLMGNLLFDDGDATHARAFGFGSGFADKLCAKVVFAALLSGR